MKNSYFKSIKKRDPAARSILQIILFYPGVQALFWYRISHFLCKIHLNFIAYFIMYLVRIVLGIEIHPKAVIGKRLFIDHGMGVVIGETTIIGDDCTIYQGVTLGGRGIKQKKRHPTLKNNVLVGAHAQLLGNIIIGNNVKIGANATVLCDVMDNKTIIGYKGHLKCEKTTESVEENDKIRYNENK